MQDAKSDTRTIWSISTFYFFTPLENLPDWEARLEAEAERLGVKGLFILGAEGLNSTFGAPSAEACAAFKNWVRESFNQPNLFFKDSESPVQPFPQIKIKVRPEIVTAGLPGVLPPTGKNRHLTPAEWDQVLENEDVAVIDTRNDYEYRIGTFKGAIDPQIPQFTDFPKFFEAQNYAPDKKILIFCTGGIRCEKGILELERQGYTNVYQLEGGILNYLKERPHRNFEGECFVFDNRVALTQDLKESSVYQLCPHCGEPGELKIHCVRCDTEAQLCPKCLEKQTPAHATCSKNCAHHHRLSPLKKGRRQVRDWATFKTVKT